MSPVDHEGLRRVATIARQLALRNAPGKGLPPLIAMTDRHRQDAGAMLDTLPPGAGLLLRDYDDPERDRRARELAPRCRAQHVRLIVADDIGLAQSVKAWGLHLPAWRVHRDGMRLAARARAAGLKVTAAAHRPVELADAARIGADMALLSPVLPTRSHPGTPHLGVVRFAAWSIAGPLPVYALGGIGPGTARRLLPTAAAGIAGIGFSD